MALMLLYGMPASAQTSHGISGKVTDQTGNGIAGASVIVKGTTTGTSTGSDGSYSLNVKDGNATLVCSFIGMKSAEAAVNGRTEVNFALEADAIGLEEVIAIGYGTIRKEEITSSITRVSSDEFLQGSVSNPLQLLQGKVAGLGISKTSGNPSGELSIMLRGISTLAASSAPLIVIDGVAGGSLNAISPEDIESIDVLKDGSAAAIYGTRGTNGVIIINTKRPQSGRVALEYKGYVTIDQMLDETSDYPDATELRSLKSRLAKEDSRFDLINDFKGDTDWGPGDYPHARQSDALCFAARRKCPDELPRFGNLQRQTRYLQGLFRRVVDRQTQHQPRNVRRPVQDRPECQQ